MKQKILFIPGIFTPKWYLKYWKSEAEKLNIEFIELENTRYSYFKINQMQERINEAIILLEKHHGENLTIVCHSFGGILINPIIQKSPKCKIKQIILLASPLQLNFFGMKKRKNILKYNPQLDYKTKIITYGGYIDFVVPFFFTKYKNEEHYNLFVEHFYFIFSKKFIRKNIQKYVLD